MPRLPLAIAAMLLPVLAHAALPPYYQRAGEMGRILTDGRVEDALQSEPIMSIAYSGTDTYEVKSETCAVTVTIIDMPAPESRQEGWAGPREFDLSVGEAVCG